MFKSFATHVRTQLARLVLAAAVLVFLSGPATMKPPAPMGDCPTIGCDHG